VLVPRPKRWLTLSQKKLGALEMAVVAPVPKRTWPWVKVAAPVPPFATGMIGVAVTVLVPLPRR